MIVYGVSLPASATSALSPAVDSHCRAVPFFSYTPMVNTVDISVNINNMTGRKTGSK